MQKVPPPPENWKISVIMTNSTPKILWLITIFKYALPNEQSGKSSKNLYLPSRKEDLATKLCGGVQHLAKNWDLLYEVMKVENKYSQPSLSMFLRMLPIQSSPVYEGTIHYLGYWYYCTTMPHSTGTPSIHHTTRGKLS